MPTETEVKYGLTTGRFLLEFALTLFVGLGCVGSLGVAYHYAMLALSPR